MMELQTFLIERAMIALNKSIGLMLHSSSRDRIRKEGVENRQEETDAKDLECASASGREGRTLGAQDGRQPTRTCRLDCSCEDSS